jgi:predicted amidohydrolase
MRIGLAQMDIIWEEPELNFIKCENLINDAKNKRVQLLLFPEMSLTGFSMNLEKLNLSEKEILDWLAEKCLTYNINIGFGYAIKEGILGRNKYVIMSDSGEILTDYIKIHPFSKAGENQKFIKGNKIVTCKIDDFIISTFICYDLRFPEIFQKASEQAQLIVVAANWPASRSSHWNILIRARAIENQCYIAGINRVGNGLEYIGGSQVVDPNGKVLTTASSNEEVIVCDIDTNEVKKVREFLEVKGDRSESYL